MSRSMTSRTKFLGLSLSSFALAGLAWSLTMPSAPATPAPGVFRYKVTITNVTRGQIFSPALVVSHNSDAAFFKLGSPASAGLALMAEDGDNSMLAAMMNGNPNVYDVRSDTGVLMPGATTEVIVAVKPNFNHISVGGMLVSTNDAFFTVDSAVAPMMGGITTFALAYDAGTEANSEDCAWIPGPPCGNGGSHDPSASEGYVHVHAGVHGIASLTPADHDWRGPVAQVRIERMN